MSFNTPPPTLFFSFFFRSTYFTVKPHIYTIQHAFVLITTDDCLHVIVRYFLISTKKKKIAGSKPWKTNHCQKRLQHALILLNIHYRAHTNEELTHADLFSFITD